MVFSFDCQGSITKENHTIQCYNGKVHGTEDFLYCIRKLL